MIRTGTVLHGYCDGVFDKDEWQRVSVTEDDTADYTDPPGTERWWDAPDQDAMPDSFDHGTPTA